MTTSLGRHSEQHELTASEYIQLLKIHIETDSDPLIKLYCVNQDLTWDDLFWSKVPFVVSGIGQKGAGERTRPKLVLPNPEGIYSPYIQKGFLEGALVTYHRLHPDSLETGFSDETYEFYISRIVESNNQYINVQLNHLTDGNRFKLPSRRFIQPEFSQVRLS